MTTYCKIPDEPVDTRDAEQIDEEQAAAETWQEAMKLGNKPPPFGASPIGVALLCVLAALDCVMARLRVDQSELQEAVARKFEQAGVKMPDGLVESQDA